MNKTEIKTGTAWYYVDGRLTGLLWFEGTEEHILWEANFCKSYPREIFEIVWE